MPDGFEFPRSSILSSAEKAATPVVRSGMLTQSQQASILGTLLGDGSIARQGYFAVNHGLPQREYLWIKYTELSEFVRGRPSLSTKSKHGYAYVRFWTVVTQEFKSLRRLIYPSGVKTVTREWLTRIDQVGFLPSVAWWVADDGTRWGPSHSPTLMICTNGFQLAEVDLLCQWLTDHGYPSSVYTQAVDGRRPYPLVAFSTAVAVRLMRDLLPWTPPCMRYKLEISGRDDTAICVFCQIQFTRQSLIRRTDLPSFPCCGAEICRKQLQRLYYLRGRKDATAVAARNARRMENYRNMDDATRQLVREQATAWQQANPVAVAAIKRRYTDKIKAEKSVTLLTCRLCGGQEPITVGRSDRMTCMPCRPAWLRLRARRTHYRNRVNLGDLTFAEELSRLDNLFRQP
jgi:hypothetical protein